MEGIQRIMFLSTVILLAFTQVSASKIPVPDSSLDHSYYLIDIQKSGHQVLNQQKNDPALRWWIEAGSQLLVYAKDAHLGAYPNAVRINLSARPERLFMVQLGHQGQLGDVDILVQAGRVAVIQARDDEIPVIQALHKHVPGDSISHAQLRLFEPNSVISRLSTNEPAVDKAKSRAWNENVATNVDSVDGERWFADLETLAGYNRYTYGEDIDSARAWLVSQFDALGLDVSEEAFAIGNTTTYNVVARLEGTSRPDEWFLVGGHYDSTSQAPSSAAPGAEDNASGTAGVLEMARIFAENPPEATIIFIAFGGEEQGLRGSRANIRNTIDAGDKDKIQGVFTMDMIGYARDADNLAVLVETNRFADEFLDQIVAAGEEFSEMTIYTTYNAFGSDHVPYLQEAVPAVLTIDNDWNRYPAYHRTNDLSENIVMSMGVEILKMNVAALSQMAF